LVNLLLRYDLYNYKEKDFVERERERERDNYKEKDFVERERERERERVSY